jgi:uncharacterized protein (DUF427 family)
MAVRMADELQSLREQWRYEPTPKRVSAKADGRTVLDSERALLVWEPGRKVPDYAVPRDDVDASVASAGRGLDEAGLPDHLLFAADAFEQWFEEDEPIIGHPRDPFTRIDVRRSARTVRVERAGEVLAESSRPSLLFETGLRVRYYLPREDVAMDLLRPTERRTICPYKGVASYFAVRVGEREVSDLVWTYEDPLPDAVAIKDLLAFYDERVDVTVDGEPRERPASPT